MKTSNKILQKIASIPVAWVLAAAILAVMMAGWMDGDLRQDPLVYGAVSKRIHESGQWDRLYFGADPYLNKPPLYFWCSALLFAIGGATPAMSRLASVVPGLFFALFLFLWLRNRGYSEKTAALPTLAAAMSPLFLEHSGAGRMETLLLLGLIGGCWALDHPRMPAWLKGIILTLSATIGWLAKSPAALIFIPAWGLMVTYDRKTWTASLRKLVSIFLFNSIGALTFGAWWMHQRKIFGPELMLATVQREYTGRMDLSPHLFWDNTVYYFENAFVGFAPLLAAIAGCTAWILVRNKQSHPIAKPKEAVPFLFWKMGAWIAAVVLVSMMTNPPAGRYLLPALPALALITAELLTRTPGLNPERLPIHILGGTVVLASLLLDLSPIQLHGSLPMVWEHTLAELSREPAPTKIIPSVGPPDWQAKGVLYYYGGFPVKKVDPPELLDDPPGTWVMLQPDDFQKLKYLFDRNLEVEGIILARLADRS